MKPEPEDMDEAAERAKQLEARADRLERQGYRCQADHLRMSAKRMCIDFGIKAYD